MMGRRNSRKKDEWIDITTLTKFFYCCSARKLHIGTAGHRSASATSAGKGGTSKTKASIAYR